MLEDLKTISFEVCINRPVDLTNCKLYSLQNFNLDRFLLAFIFWTWKFQAICNASRLYHIYKL